MQTRMARLQTKEDILSFVISVANPILRYLINYCLLIPCLCSQTVVLLLLPKQILLTDVVCYWLLIVYVRYLFSFRISTHSALLISELFFQVEANLHGVPLQGVPLRYLHLYVRYQRIGIVYIGMCEIIIIIITSKLCL